MYLCPACASMLALILFTSLFWFSYVSFLLDIIKLIKQWCKVLCWSRFACTTMRHDVLRSLLACSSTYLPMWFTYVYIVKRNYYVNVTIYIITTCTRWCAFVAWTISKQNDCTPPFLYLCLTCCAILYNCYLLLMLFLISKSLELNQVNDYDFYTIQ